MDLFEKVSEDIKTAMKAKDKVALETLRNVKKVFLEAKTAPGANDTLSDADALKIIQKLTKQGKDAAEIYVQQGRQDLADDELAQVKVLETYLPKQMSAEELEAALKEIIAEVGATSGKDMGKVMGVASKKLAGLAEGRAISAKSKRVAGIKKYTSPYHISRASTEGLSVQSLLNTAFYIPIHILPHKRLYAIYQRIIFTDRLP